MSPSQRPSSATPPSQAEAVIIGAGIVGASVAYHLARRGIDVVVLERDRITSGTTWHAAGLLAEFRPTRRLTELAKYSMALYAGLEEETGQATGLKRNGSLSIATEPGRWEELRRGATIARGQQIDVELMSAAETRSLWPLLNTDDVTGSAFYPGDGQINPVDVTMALVKAARGSGARFFEQQPAGAVKVIDGKVRGLDTAQGHIRTDVVVNCAGMWARQLGLNAGVAVPLHACEHFYCLTEAIDGLPGNLPVLRDYDGCAYYKEDAGKLLIGAFEPVAKPWASNGVPEDFSFGELPDDLDHLMPILEGATRRVPVIESLGFSRFFNGPESFTSDDRYLLGPAPELAGYYVAAGFNSIGIQSAGGAGQVLADWIVDGHPTPDLWDVDIRRTFSFQNDVDYLRERVSETLGLLYAMHWPYRQYTTSRNQLMSPLHARLSDHGACFGELSGWERANWFAHDGMTPTYQYSFDAQNWHVCQAAEHHATRNAVAIFDQTSFAKFDVTGKDTLGVLQQICANDIAGPPGKLTYTQWLNERGGIEADLTVVRIDSDHFRIITAPATRRKDWHWLVDHIDSRTDCRAYDVTESLAVISLMGPHSRTLLGELTDTDLSNEGFAFATAQPMVVSDVPVWAQRITFVGELGWELYVANDHAAMLYDALMEAGRPLGITNAGYHALDSCRIEKAYRHWGHDISDADTPLEAGLSFACAFDKPSGFIGRDALLRQRDAGIHRRLVQFLLPEAAPRAYHDEPIFRDGTQMGHVTSANYGHTLGGCVALGYVGSTDVVTPGFVKSGAYEIEIAGERIPATARLRPMYDPSSQRVKN